MRRLFKPLILIFAGGGLYLFIEILWRGRTAWEMLLVGGIAFYLVGLINEILSWETPLYRQAFIATTIITIVELIAGLLVNRDYMIWDYRNMPFNLYGQICFMYSILWYFLSFVAIVFDDYLRYWILGEEKPRYNFIKKRRK